MGRVYGALLHGCSGTSATRIDRRTVPTSLAHRRAASRPRLRATMPARRPRLALSAVQTDDRTDDRA